MTHEDVLRAACSVECAVHGHDIDEDNRREEGYPYVSYIVYTCARCEERIRIEALPGTPAEEQEVPPYEP